MFTSRLIASKTQPQAPGIFCLYKVIVGYPPNERVLIEVKLPDNVELLETSTLKQFRYNPTGNTTTFGVVRFKVDDSPVNIHFHLAKGRFYVEF